MVSRGTPVTSQAPEQRHLSNATFYLVAASLFLSITRLHMSIPILAVLKFPQLLSVSAFFAMLAEMRHWRPGDLGKHWIPKAVCLLLVVAIGGAPASIYPGRSARFLWESYSVTVVLALLAWGVARTPRGTAFIARLFASSAVVTTVLAMIRNRRDKDGRLGGAYTYDANDLALIAAVSIPILIWWAMDKKAKYRWVAMIAIPLTLRVVLQTGSRGGLLGLAAIAAGLVIVGVSGGRNKLRPYGIALGLGAVLSFPLLPEKYQERFRSITDDGDYNMTSISGRKAVWTRGWGYMISRPLFGVGIDNFRTAEGTLSEIGQWRQSRNQGMKWSQPHNSFLQVGAEMGVVAGAVFALTMLAIPVALIRRYRRHNQLLGRAQDADRLPALLAVSVITYIVTGFFLSQAYGDVVYQLLAMSAAVLMQPGPSTLTAPVQRRLSRQRRVTA